MENRNFLSKAFIEDNTQIADFLNFVFYEGRQVITSEKLTRIIPALSVVRNNEKFKPFLTDGIDITTVKSGNNTFVILSVTDQAEANYAAPLWAFSFELMYYAEQLETCSNEKLHSIFTVFIYWDSDKWNGPRTLAEMYNITDEAYLKAIPKYNLNLVSPYEMTNDDFGRFTTALGETLRHIKYSEDNNTGGNSE